MKITVVTACRNSARTISSTLESVRRQTLPDGVELEHIVIDGASTDGTVEMVKAHADAEGIPRLRVVLVSEPDRGLYDALNKGIRLATGAVVGTLNADDAFAADDVVARVAEAFRADASLEVTYGDVRFVRKGETLGELRAAPSVRYCTGRYFRPWMFRFATFPAHPSTFVRRDCFARCGDYSLDYPICADFEMMLRLFVVHKVRARYLPFCTTVMRTGGLSTGGLGSNVEINREDLRALRAHGVRSSQPLIYLKYFAKVFGLLRKSEFTLQSL